MELSAVCCMRCIKSYSPAIFSDRCYRLTLISLKLFIKNMVCIRCKMVVKDELTKLGLQYTLLN
jgi:hypothetical protein